MRSLRRWAIVAVGTAVLLLLPWAISHRPVPKSSVSASALLAQIRGSSGVAYSGLAESVGGLQLPDAKQLSAVTSLLGDRNQLRVWWGGAQSWRVDTISPTGETGLHLDGGLLWSWDYEANRAISSITYDGQVHLPRSTDLLPPQLALRLLADATAKDVTRLPTQRVAGRTAAGLRLTPSQPQSTIAHVDVWADPATGLPLKVVAAGKSSGVAAMETHFLDLNMGAPSAGLIDFNPPPGAKVQFNNNADPLTALDQRFPRPAPDQLAGLDRVKRQGISPAVSIYGHGVTSMVLVPLRGDDANSLLQQLTKATAIPVDSSSGADTITISVGPVNMMVSVLGRRGYVLAGTVTTDAMQTAANDLETANQQDPFPR